MGVWRRRTLSGTAAAALLLGALAAPPAAAYSSPEEVPNPFQDYSAQDYYDALWNLETTTYVRELDRESGEDCDVITYRVSHPLGLDPERTYVHISDAENWWCTGQEADELREEFDALDEEDPNFYHGRPYENTAQRVPYYGTWADVNGNGVNSRTEIHARDLGNSSFTVSGTYWDHYSGQYVDIAQTETHGEHMIPVGHTWPEMQHRSREDRVAYYNDPMNLTSTIGWINREKAGQTPAEWMPENTEAHCAYGMTWTHIANKHQISLFQQDVNYLRDLLWDCLEEELEDGEVLGDGGVLGGQRSEDLDWQALPPEPASEDVAAEPGGGPRDHYSDRDYADALWNLEHHVRTRSVEREEHEECDVLSFTTTHPRTGEERTYARVTTPENTQCSGEEADELREELDEQAEEDENFFHGSPLAGQRQEAFGGWSVDGAGVSTRHRVLGRDLEAAEWNNAETAVLGGTFYDPYTGEQMSYRRFAVTLDHILPVGHAWPEMEHRDAEERAAFYNDPANLLAVPTLEAQERSGEAPRNWMPEHEGFHCRYAMGWVHTAVRYDISLFGSDISQLRETLYACLVEETDGGSLDGPRREALDWASLPPY
ncbi:hypothetical protein [Nesterenkonia alkaliphila]|uniref:DUF1524 domain-containing protein n=1 Tax=Nesterenkonia alkaliphila TaxID=1463631 RepID=A0A7K1UIB9_9MICC|nr:hypothetical protein [Nesterenkonia alkaliphila]MVT26220.1 hypothetical protein [Nesterenkonia alkaliphila]GFZ84538.1 hypothetical protein GCM10011359_11890 [Nesterenkonia alkaliphila]